MSKYLAAVPDLKMYVTSLRKKNKKSVELNWIELFSLKRCVVLQMNDASVIDYSYTLV